MYCTLLSSDKLYPYLPTLFLCEFMLIFIERRIFASLCITLAKMYTFWHNYPTAFNSYLHLCLPQEWLLWTYHHLKELYDRWFYASDGSDS